MSSSYVNTNVKAYNNYMLDVSSGCLYNSMRSCLDTLGHLDKCLKEYNEQLNDMKNVGWISYLWSKEIKTKDIEELITNTKKNIDEVNYIYNYLKDNYVHDNNFSHEFVKVFDKTFNLQEVLNFYYKVKLIVT
jgi:hypothetical protein